MTRDCFTCVFFKGRDGFRVMRKCGPCIGKRPLPNYEPAIAQTVFKDKFTNPEHDAGDAALTSRPDAATATQGDASYDPNSTRGLRFNKGKRRYDLLPVDAIAALVDVFTIGAEKYAPRNWEKGMPWAEVSASLQRHLASFLAGEDRDPETKQLHIAHVAWNAIALLTYQLRGAGTDDRAPCTIHETQRP